MTSSRTVLLTGIAALGLALILSTGAGGKPGPAAANKQSVREVFLAMDRQDYARCRELWPAAEPGRKPFRIVGSPDMDREELIGFLQAYWKAFPDTVHVLEELVAEGDMVVAHVRCEGTHRGPLEDLPPTGRRVRYEGIHIVRFAGGRIRSWWAMDDNLGLMQQLGMQLAPRPGPPEPPIKGQ